MSQENHGPNGADVAPEGAESPPGDADSGRGANGRWLPGTSGNPAGMPRGTFSLARHERKRLGEPPTEQQRRQAAIGAGVKESEVPHLDCLGSLLGWVAEMRALAGHGTDFAQIFDRLDPKPNKVDVAVERPKRSQVPEGAPADVEREASEEFYDRLHS